MKRIVFSLVLVLLFSAKCFAQVGINTSKPKKTLHVNGSLHLGKELSVGGDTPTEESEGKSGQFLMSMVQEQFHHGEIPFLNL